ncbi:MAG: zinc ribbon domain-containing protein [Erysipelotrichaceae bacterium]|nr:zinc ribbon domain-containing protein [Erysipelotrichaceae bacterium]
MNEHEEMLQARFESKLTTCPDCMREVSKLAITCPHCGRPLQLQVAPPVIEQPNTQNQPAQSTGISFWGIVLAVIFAAFILSVL